MLRIASACATREAFVALFGRYCDGEVIFVATRSPRPTGEDLSFTISLAGGQPLIAATGRVEGSYLEDNGPHGRAGMLIRFHDVAIASQGLVDELAHVQARQGSFPRGTGPLSMDKHDTIAEIHPLEDGMESDHETLPSGLPRALARSRPTPAPIVVPRPNGPLTIKPAATPAPVPFGARPGRSDEPNAKSIASIGRSRIWYSDGADSEFGNPAGREESGDLGFGDPAGRGARAGLRGDYLGRLEAPSLEALAECTLFEENAECDELGLPTVAIPEARTDVRTEARTELRAEARTEHRTEARPETRTEVRTEVRSEALPNDDAWDDDETIPPWLRGPQPDDVMDAPIGVSEAESPIGRIVGRVAFHDPGPVRIPEQPTAPAAPPLPAPSMPLSAGRAYEREEAQTLVAINLAAVNLPATVAGGQAPSVRPGARWPLVLVSSLVSVTVGLALGYAAGTAGLLTLVGGEQQEARASRISWSEPAGQKERHAGAAGAGTGEGAKLPPDSVPAGNLGDGHGNLGDGHGDVGGGQEAGAGNVVDGDDRPGGEIKPSGDDQGVREGRGRRGKRAAGRDRALAPDACAVEVESEPGGCEIAIDGEVKATSPARVELPCGAHDVEVRHSRYQSALRRVRLRPGKLEQLDVRLERPDHKLRITSAPSGAAVTLNGRPVGNTPVVATVKGYKHVRVRVERPGYDAWSERVYAREPLTKLTVKLTPLRSIPTTRPSIELTPQWLPQPRPTEDAGPN